MSVFALSVLVMSLFYSIIPQKKEAWAIHSHVANTLRLASLKEQKLFFSRLAGNWQGSLAGENQKQLVCLKQGKAEGILRGGNLTSLVSLVGSKTSGFYK